MKRISLQVKIMVLMIILVIIPLAVANIIFIYQKTALSSKAVYSAIASLVDGDNYINIKRHKLSREELMELPYDDEYFQGLVDGESGKVDNEADGEEESEKSESEESEESEDSDESEESEEETEEPKKDVKKAKTK